MSLDNEVIGQFGHCTQELMNLLLTGRATSNVFDGDVLMDAGTSAIETGIMCKGIRTQSQIGYLSLLEALRFIQVYFM